MKTYTNNEIKKQVEHKGIKCNEDKVELFEKYGYYQVINAYKNIFSISIEYIADIIINVDNGNDIERYKQNYNISKEIIDNSEIKKEILKSICEKYGLEIKQDESEDALKAKIDEINYYNHIYSKRVNYGHFIRMYKFEHDLRCVLIKYTLLIEENLKNIFVSYLNNIGAKGNFLTDINQYETSNGKRNNAINSIKKVFDKHTNKYSKPIQRKNYQNIVVPYWIIINEFTLGETLNTIINLKSEHSDKIIEECLNYFTKLKLNKNEAVDEEVKKEYINTMRELLKIIGQLRNCLAHNQPIYSFNTKDFSSQKRK